MTRGDAPRRGPQKPGLQGERTKLAWERCTLALLASALLLLLRHVGPDLWRVVLVTVQVGLALLTGWFGRRRAHQISALPADSRAHTTVPDAHRELLGVTLAVAAMALGTTLTILFTV